MPLGVTPCALVPASILILALVSNARGADVNPDYEAAGDDCGCGVIVTLDDEFDVTDHMDGHEDELHWEYFNWWNTDTDRTKLCWTEPEGGACTESGHGGWMDEDEEFHLGWSTDPESNDSNIESAYYYTSCDDLCSGGSGDAVGGFPGANVGGVYAPTAFDATFRNDIEPAMPVFVNNIRYELVVNPYVLADLNGLVLTNLLPIAGDAELDFGQDFVVGIPLGARAEVHVVLAYDVHTVGEPESKTTMYVQFHPAEPIPAVSEWGLMVMALLILTAGTIVFARRRRPAAA